MSFLFLFLGYFLLQNQRSMDSSWYNDTADVMDDFLHATTMIPCIAGKSIYLTSTFHGILRAFIENHSESLSRAFLTLCDL